MSYAGDLDSVSYVEDEVLIQGTARSYQPAAPLEDVADGRWDATPTGPPADYTTRLLIRRPQNPARFNGTVIVDWLNVSAGFDLDVFPGMRDEIVRQGYAYVGVSAQAAGANFLKTWETGDRARYASVVHPGDSYSYDIFSQAAQAITDPRSGGPAPLGNLTGRIEALIAHGSSQSGTRLFSYVNAVHPTASVYDGFLVTLTVDPGNYGGAPLSQAPLPEVPLPTGANAVIRTDADTPVLFVNSETELVAGARGVHSQSDGSRLRVWEIAGAAHATASYTEDMAPQLEKAGLPPVALDCSPLPVNDIHQPAVWRAGLRAVNRWTTTGRAPTRASRVEVEIPSDRSRPVTIVRDPATGLSTGGIRLPDVAAPIRTLTGERPPAALVTNPFCFLFGATDPWNGNGDAYDGNPLLDPSPTPEPSLSTLYGNESSYVSAVRHSARRLVRHGFLLPDDARELIAEAHTVEIP